MGTVFLHGNGGSGGSGGGFGLQVVGNPRPKNPTEGNVWVNTDVDITGYFLSAEQPENFAEGNLWIKISDSSNIKVGTPLGKDYITIMLNSVSQYIGGKLVSVEAKSFQNGVWVDWFFGLVNDGVIVGSNKFELYTGTASTTTVDGVLRCVITGNANANYYTKDKVNFTDISQIVIDIAGGKLQYDAYFGLSSNKVQSSGENVNVFSASIKIPKGTVSKQTYTLDLSGVPGQYYFGLSMAYTSSIISDIYQHSGIDIKSIEFVRG